MRISTNIGGILAVSLAVTVMACSSKDNNYSPIPVYPAGSNAMPADGSLPPAAATPLPPLSPEEIGPTINYIVKEKDSLWKIAKNHKTTIARLKRVNGLDKDLILVGQVLKIPDQIAGTTTTPAVQPKPAPAGGFRKPSTTATPPNTPQSGGGLKLKD